MRDFGELDGWLKDLVGRDGFSGVVLVERAGEVLFHRAYGLANRADGIPNKLETRFGAASVTKTLTAVGIAKLVMAGKVKTDDLVGKYLKFLSPEVGQPVTVHHLLTHTSGLPNFLKEGLNDAAGIASLGFPLPAQRVTRDYVPTIAKMKLVNEPGKVFVYGNTGFVMLGLIIEEVCGEPYETYLAREVLGPAGMKHSAFMCRDEVHPNVSVGYKRREKPTDPWRSDIYFATVGPHGGIYTTSEDLLVYLRRLIGFELLPEAVTRHFMELKVWEDEIMGYGYGFRHWDLPSGQHAVGHMGAGSGSSARVFWLPKDR